MAPSSRLPASNRSDGGHRSLDIPSIEQAVSPEICAKARSSTFLQRFKNPTGSASPTGKSEPIRMRSGPTRSISASSVTGS